MAPEAGTLPRPALLALADDLRALFPEVGGRAIAVSEAEITKENLPDLPLIMCALVRDLAEGTAKSNQPYELTETVVVEYQVKAERYKKADGSESPFWAYYDYEPVRDRLIAFSREWRSPRNGILTYRGMDIESDRRAVVMTFSFEHKFLWCAREANVETPPACIQFGVKPKFDFSRGVLPEVT